MFPIVVTHFAPANWKVLLSLSLYIDNPPPNRPPDMQSVGTQAVEESVFTIILCKGGVRQQIKNRVKGTATR